MDKRLNAFRPDLADLALKGQVEADRYTQGAKMRVIAPAASVHREPRFDAMQVTQALFGEEAEVFDVREGWAWVQLVRDRYVGYVSRDALTEVLEQPTHRVAVPSTHLYPNASIKSQPATILPMHAAFAAEESDGFLRLGGSRFVFARHSAPTKKREADPAAIAERFLNVPYYWGGKTFHGLDCSGLVQLSLQACGIEAPRDSDMQEEALGKPVTDARRNDLVFWKGHVGIMWDETTLLHANGHHMMVVKEPFAEAVERIGKPTSIKRL
jgi:cell wall-associated NlpC family hydrolase